MRAAQMHIQVRIDGSRRTAAVLQTTYPRDRNGSAEEGRAAKSFLTRLECPLMLS